MSRKLNPIGEIFTTNNCDSCVIIGYKNNQDVLVKFVDFECEVKTNLASLRKGKVTNPSFPSVYGVGWIGVGDYNSADSRLYNLWLSLLCRSCNEDFKSKNKTYKDVSVCKEWLCFQNFAAWCEGQTYYGEVDKSGSRYELDKDILVKGNKIYSPDTCCFVPKELNLLLRNNLCKRGDLPVGVSYVKKRSLYLVTHKVRASTKFVGHFETAEDAFLAYKTSKECLIKRIANEYIDKIDISVYNALINYEIEITD